MKRINNLYNKIADINNIYKADEKARKCKRKSYGVKKHDENQLGDNFNLYLDLCNQEYRTSKYTTFKIYEPKERVIFRLPYYPDRITHHAIMNIMEPIWVNIFTKDTYSCIKGRGIHALSKNLKNDLINHPKETEYCLKLDIRKFYPSINHDILKEIIRKKIKDKSLLKLLDEIIDSAEGVPIGNYLSQFFANLYLAYFDHWVKEELKVKFYYRYADDIVLLSNDKSKLRSWLLAIKLYLTNVLDLKVKDNYQIFPVESHGIDFVGYVFRHKYTKLRKNTKKKIWKLVNALEKKKISISRFKRSMASYAGWLKYCDSKNLLRKIELLTGIRYSNWNGGNITFSDIVYKWIYLVTVETRKGYYIMHFMYRNKAYSIKSKDVGLFNFLRQINRFPAKIKLTHVYSSKT